MTPPRTIQKLLPEPAEVPLEEAYRSLGLQDKLRPAGPTWSPTWWRPPTAGPRSKGRTKAISSEADRELFHWLREEVDAVMAGVATIALERYGPLVPDARRRDRRAARGLDPVPLAVTATRSIELPVEAPLFADRWLADRRADAIGSGGAARTRRACERHAGRGARPGAGLAALRERHGVRALLLEGGPTLLAAMVGARLVDELFLSVAPVLAGGAGEVSILEGAVGDPVADGPAVGAP